MRILILYASTGGGHKRTSAAMKKYIEESRPNDVVRMVDALEQISHIYNKTVSEGYELMVKAAPKFFGTVYNQTNKDSTMNDLAVKIQHRLAKKLLPLMVEFRPDVIITVQAFCVDMAARIKSKYKMDIPIISLITDFATHKMYVQDGVDAYVVSNSEMVNSLKELGVDESAIQVSGIPIDPDFYHDFDKQTLIRKFGLSSDLPIVLFMAGSFGVKAILKIYLHLVETSADFQAIVVTGKNKKLYDEFNDILDDNYENMETSTDDTTESHIKYYIGNYGVKPTKLLYFVDNIQEYMYISDLIVTKPGGLTVSESIVSVLPMAIFSAFPGQEADNADYLEKHNLAIRLPKKESAKAIHELMLNTEKLETMRNACRQHNMGNSAKQIIELAENLVKSYHIKNKTYDPDLVKEIFSQYYSVTDNEE